MLLCKKIRLEISQQDATALEFMQGKCRGLYNWQVMRLRNGEKWPGVFEAKKTLQASNSMILSLSTSMASSCRRSIIVWMPPCKPFSDEWHTAKRLAFHECAHAIASSPCAIRPY